MLEAATWLVYVIIAFCVFSGVLIAIFVPLWIREWKKMGREWEEMDERMKKGRGR